MSESKNPTAAIIGVVIGTLAAIGGGFAFSFLGIKNLGAPSETAVAAAKTPLMQSGEARSLAPIVTNLRDPSDLYVRVEAAVLLEPGISDGGAIAAKIADDLVSYLRTVALSELNSPTGFQYLKEDLRKRSIQLGGGKVKDLLLQSFVVQ